MCLDRGKLDELDDFRESFESCCPYLLSGFVLEITAVLLKTLQISLRCSRYSVIIEIRCNFFCLRSTFFCCQFEANNYFVFL